MEHKGATCGIDDKLAVLTLKSSDILKMPYWFMYF